MSCVKLPHLNLDAPFNAPFFLLTELINGLSCSSQIAQFHEFLLRANKYNCLKLAGDGEAINKKLILVEVCPSLANKYLSLNYPVLLTRT